MSANPKTESGLKRSFSKAAGVLTILAATFAFAAFTPEAQAQGYRGRTHGHVNGSVSIGSRGGHIGVNIHVGSGRSHGNIHYRHRIPAPRVHYPDHHHHRTYPRVHYPDHHHHRHVPRIISRPPVIVRPAPVIVQPAPVIVQPAPVIVQQQPVAAAHQHDINCGHYNTERLSNAISRAAEDIYSKGYTPVGEVRQVSDQARNIQRNHAPGLDARIIENEIRDKISAIRQTALEQQAETRNILPTPPLLRP